MSKTRDNSPRTIPEDLLKSSLPAHTDPFRSLSAKRRRDPSHRKSVSFNDVPIVHEVPSHDVMRNSNSDIYRSWTFTETTSPISVVSPFSSSQILPSFHSPNAAAQKLHANRLSSALYSSSANNTTLNRFSDWPLRTKTVKTVEETTEYNPPLIVVHKPDEQTNKNFSLIENGDEKKYSYRSAIIPDTEHYRNLPFTYVPLSESTSTYTSMLSTSHIQSNEQTSNGSIRTLRARSATLPITVTNNSPLRTNENVSGASFRPVTSSSSSRTILKPATIAFHGSTSPSTSKPPAIPPRSHSFAAHSRLVSASNRPLSSSINRHSTSSTTLSRARSAHVSSTRHQVASPMAVLDGQTNPNNLYASTKRNPNVRPTYGSYYIPHVLLPANIN